MMEEGGVALLCCSQLSWALFQGGSREAGSESSPILFVSLEHVWEGRHALPAHCHSNSHCAPQVCVAAHREWGTEKGGKAELSRVSQLGTSSWRAQFFATLYVSDPQSLRG